MHAQHRTLLQISHIPVSSFASIIRHGRTVFPKCQNRTQWPMIKWETSNRIHTHLYTHTKRLSCLWVARTNRGYEGFDSALQATIAQQGWPFTDCQAALQHEAVTKSHWMWSFHKEMKGTQWLQVLNTQARTKTQTNHTHTHPPHTSFLSHPALLPSCGGTAAGLFECQSHWWIYSTVSEYCLPTWLCLSVFHLSWVKVFYKLLMFPLELQNIARL